MLPSGNIKLPRLRSDLQYSIHQQGDRRWYCVQDPSNGQFYRIGAREYAIASRFQSELSPEQLATQLSEDQEAAPLFDRNVTAAEVMQLSAWMIRSGLCEQEYSSNRTATLYRKWILNPLSMRIPLISGHLLEIPAKWIAPWLTTATCLAIVVGYLVAIVVAFGNWNLLSQTTSKLFVSDSQLWWAAAWLILKVFHELGHAAVAVRVGSQIRAAGLNVIFFAPIPYVDVSDLWSIPNRLHRIACSASGILTEMAIASLAVFVAVSTQSESIRYLCCAIAVTGTITTLAFNANPLMRFDGYYILADLLNIHNLWTSAQTSFGKIVRRVFNPWRERGQSMPNLLFASYGAASLFYRTLMSLTMAATAILVWKSVGILLVLWAGYAMYLNPWITATRKDLSAQRLAGTNGAQPSWKTRGWSATVVLLLLATVTFLPSPVQPSAPGVVAYREPVQINAESAGILERVEVKVGDHVLVGQVIAVLEDPELNLELTTKRLEAQAVQESLRTQQARGNLADLQAAQARLESLQTQLSQLERRVERLTITASEAGQVVQLLIDHSLGQNLAVGTPVCLIATSNRLDAKISASQRDLLAFRQAVGKPISVTVVGGRSDIGTIEQVELKGSAFLAEPLLAGCYHGPVPVEYDSAAKHATKQLKLLSPRFDVHIRLPENSNLTPGQMVWTRVPGESSSIAGAVGQWLKFRWDGLKHQLNG